MLVQGMMAPPQPLLQQQQLMQQQMLAQQQQQLQLAAMLGVGRAVVCRYVHPNMSTNRQQNTHTIPARHEFQVL